MTEENHKTIQERLAARPDSILELEAEKYGVTMLETLRALPEGMITERDCDPDIFLRVVSEIDTWSKVTTIVHTGAGVFEYVGPFPKGSTGGGFYNLREGESGFCGHIRYKRCNRIIFLERTFMKVSSAGILFMNEEGDCMFKVYVGRGEDRQVLPEQYEAFKALRESLA